MKNRNKRSTPFSKVKKKNPEESATHKEFCQSATKPIIKATSAKPTHTSYTSYFTKPGQRHIKFQTDFNLILCASGDDKGHRPHA